MACKVIDASVFLCYFLDEPSSYKAMQLFKEAALRGENLRTPSITWGETLYIIEKRYGSKQVTLIERLIDQMGIEIVPVGRTLARQAVSLKSQFDLPYADCFLAALALEHRTTLVTKDNDFRLVEHLITVQWLE